MDFKVIDQIHFSWLCVWFEKILKADSKHDKKRLLYAFMSHFEKGEEFHAILRLFLPELERVRGPYGVKDHNLAKTYIRILGLPPDGDDAKKLKNYGATSSKRGDNTGDFAEVAYWVLLNKCGESKKLTIGEVNASLNAVSEKHAARDPRGVDYVLTDLINKMSAIEQKWLIRIILKKMQLGLSKDQILKCYHPDASDLYDRSNSIHKICCTLKKGVRLHEVSITLFESFRPMLCARSEVNKFEITESMYVESKMDGERFQIHYQDGKFKYFSRQGFEYTQNFGEDEHCGHYTKQIKNQFEPSLKSFILDGELMVWDPNRKSLIHKGPDIDVKKLRIGNKVQPCFYAFDILYLNGEVLSNLKLSDRLRFLEKVFKPLEGVIMGTPRKIVNKTEEVLAAVNSAIDKLEEGIVMKKMDSIYKPSARNAGWYKIKPEYTDNALVELDVLIIGGYYGSGKYRGKVSHFLLGLAQPNDEGSPRFFESLSRVGSGFSDVELEEITNKLSPHWNKFRPESKPKFLLLASEKPDLWIEPKNSCVLQVKATEVEKSTKYYCGYSLRFVRIERARYDKPWTDCLTTDEFHKLRLASGGKLTAGHIEESSRSKPRKRPHEIDSILMTKRQAKEEDMVCNIFSKKEFCILSGDPPNKTKEDIEQLIMKNGGAVLPAPTSNTTCLIAGKKDLKVKNAIKSAKHNIVSYEWIVDCVNARKYLDWTPAYMIGSTFAVKKELETQFDLYGDSYTVDVTPESLKSIFNSMRPKVTFEESLLHEVDNTVFNESSPYSFFRNNSAFFAMDEADAVKCRLGVEMRLFSFYGGRILKYPDQTVSLIVIRESSKIPADVNDHVASFGPVDIITSQWILDCCKIRRILAKDKYLVNVP